VWWTIFTAVDLYIGLILLETMAPSVPPEKLGRLKAARKAVIALLALSAVVLVFQVVRRH
jgi:hypothetical protein